MRDEDIKQAADLFLRLWQENIRLWAAEKDLLPHAELAALLEATPAMGQKPGPEE